jgi:succinoglycan biosynthesis protein ExoL
MRKCLHKVDRYQRRKCVTYNPTSETQLVASRPGEFPEKRTVPDPSQLNWDMGVRMRPRLPVAVGSESKIVSQPESTTVPAPALWRLVYLVHDLADPAVARRLVMLRPFLASAVAIGFYRSAAPPAQVAGWPTVALGRTENARLGHRLLSVLRTRATIRRLRPYLQGADVVMARQLEMLVLARTLRGRYAASATLAYECLDIHRLMVAPSLVGSMLRRLEKRLLRAADLLIVSSPAFLSEHLEPVHGSMLPPTCLIENKVQRTEIIPRSAPQDRQAGPPWRIGWYGVLRCRRSLQLLAELTRQLPGQVTVELRGRPALSAIPDFDALVAGAPGLSFLGPYDRQFDLARLYQAVHFTWAIDFYEDGANSEWLLPNRLYEGGAHGAVPIALKTVETGRWLVRNATGILLAEPIETDLPRYFSALTLPAYTVVIASLAAVSGEKWVDEGADGQRLATALLHHRQRP